MSALKSSLKTQKGKESRASGYKTEDLAVENLSLQGYKILARNFTANKHKGTGCGEIDIIAEKDNTLVFIEVKKRQNIELCADAITLKNKQRVTRTAECFLALHPEYADFSVRFDAVLVAKGIFRHEKDAWRPDWW